MKLWCDGAHGAAENMRRDSELLASLERQGGEAVMRLYRFSPHGITLGRSQDPARELDLERCAAEGIPWAVRPTGGRAIFHAEEWTYGFAARIDDPRWGGSLGECYAAVGRWVIASLLRLGVPAEYAPAGARSGAPRAGRSAAAPCFASTGRHEILLGGGKLVGSAQRRLRRAFLQQGSLLLGSGHLRLVDFVRVPEGLRAGIRADLERRSAHAGDRLGKAPLERWADALGAELGRSAERLDGDAALAALTLSRDPSYTRSFPLNTSDWSRT